MGGGGEGVEFGNAYSPQALTIGDTHNVRARWKTGRVRSSELVEGILVLVKSGKRRTADNVASLARAYAKGRAAVVGKGRAARERDRRRHRVKVNRIVSAMV